ncbi:GntR family transcriptional regulator [Saccharopolyspora terrae]|uniref:GntR family transcriptional regulator n=1 Tax=Saccharopolyspora terrae TaxID=2530384 RepID=A0A4R4VQM5_9PSEU|nr:winged helix-turn-helix domain-containing protein [Saccharopolyspora terrae]TDD08102.1 GntR family transcriptional regulator [Saccharopolyspora terrae]
MGKVDPDSPRAPYQQVADYLRTAIHDGTLGPGQRLPKQAELVAEYGVSLGTVKSALAVLRDERLIISRQGEGTWVRREGLDGPAETAPGSDDARDMLTEVVQRLDAISERLARIEQRLPQG